MRTTILWLDLLTPQGKGQTVWIFSSFQILRRVGGPDSMLFVSHSTGLCENLSCSFCLLHLVLYKNCST